MTQMQIASRRNEETHDRDECARDPGDLVSRARRVAAVAADHAADVDQASRFPAEAMAAARTERLLGVMAPRGLGGEGASISELAEVCYVLGQACASTAMIFAMHQATMACVLRHGLSSPWHVDFVREAAAWQLLLASSTTEGERGSDIRNSEAPVVTEGTRIRLDRIASVVSYGEAADAIVTTARRAPDADSSDQVLVVLRREHYTLERISVWNALGMRGTCSNGYNLHAVGESCQIVPGPYGPIHTQSMVPASHLLWASVWTGIAAAAVERARRHLRKRMRGQPDSLPLGVAHVQKAKSSLRTLRALISTTLSRYEDIAENSAALSTIEFQSAISLLKVDVSELAVATALTAMRACGLAGYLNDSEASIGRHVRDLLSSPIMINNDRILGSNQGAALLSPVFSSLRD
jgi:acyl-CoA dehydrogenase